jgi:hypothetical protein
MNFYDDDEECECRDECECCPEGECRCESGRETCSCRTAERYRVSRGGVGFAVAGQQQTAGPSHIYGEKNPLGRKIKLFPYKPPSKEEIERNNKEIEAAMALLRREAEERLYWSKPPNHANMHFIG